MVDVSGMSKFAGIHLSAIRDDDSNSTSNLKRGVDCLQFILMKFRQLDQERYVNLKLGLCLNYGPLNIGMFEDNSRVYFDIAGPTRDKAMQIAMKEENDVFFSSCFLNEMKIAFPDKKFKSFTGEGITSGQSFSSSNIKWYHLELFDAFNFAGNFGFSRNMKVFLQRANTSYHVIFCINTILYVNRIINMLKFWVRVEMVRSTCWKIKSIKSW